MYNSYLKIKRNPLYTDTENLKDNLGEQTQGWKHYVKYATICVKRKGGREGRGWNCRVRFNINCWFCWHRALTSVAPFGPMVFFLVLLSRCFTNISMYRTHLGILSTIIFLFGRGRTRQSVSLSLSLHFLILILFIFQLSAFLTSSQVTPKPLALDHKSGSQIMKEAAFSHS